VAGQRTQSTAPHERHPYPCQRAYGNFRKHILKLLTQPRQSRLSNCLQRTARAGFLILDMPARWLMNLFDAVVGNRGYLAVGSVLAAYLAAFGLIDTKSTQEETRAALERSLFITLVSSGNPAFVAAMKNFGPTQTIPVIEHLSLLKFWEWGRSYQPNREPMLHWAQWRLALCSKETKDCSLEDNLASFEKRVGGNGRSSPSSPSNARWSGGRGAGPSQALAAEGGGRKARL
jgi:hypothetical protein